jgi:hypothetical protein
MEEGKTHYLCYLALGTHFVPERKTHKRRNDLLFCHTLTSVGRLGKLVCAQRNGRNERKCPPLAVLINDFAEVLFGNCRV